VASTNEPKNAVGYLWSSINLTTNLLTLCHRPHIAGVGEHNNCWRSRYLWSNDQCPDIDPVRILLAYLYVIGWKGGTLFPSFPELDNPPADGVYKTHLDETQLYQSLNEIYQNVLKREEHLGCHTGRKTGYLFACLQGCKDVATIMAAADHECPKVALGYLRDAEALKEILRCYNDPRQQVGNWRNPHSAGGENAVHAVAEGAKHQRPLPELVVGFIENRVRIPLNHPRRLEPQYVYSQVIQWRKPGVNPSRELAIHLQDISQDRIHAITNCVGQMVNAAVTRAEDDARAEAARVKAAWLLSVVHIKARLKVAGVADEIVKDAFSQVLPVDTDPPSGTELNSHTRRRQLSTHDASVPPVKKAKYRRSGTQKLPDATNIQRWTAEAKLQYIDENADYNASDFEEKGRQMIMKIKPIATCYRRCCDKNIEQFLAKHGKPTSTKGGADVMNFAITKFKGCETCKKQE
jgi:hypothetical protein